TITVTGTSQNISISTWEYSVDGGTFSTTAPSYVSRNDNTVTVTGSGMTNRTLVIKASNGSVYDIITIAKVEDGDKGDPGDSAKLVDIVPSQLYFIRKLQGDSYVITPDTITLTPEFQN